MNTLVVLLGLLCPPLCSSVSSQTVQNCVAAAAAAAAVIAAAAAADGNADGVLPCRMLMVSVARSNCSRLARLLKTQIDSFISCQ